MRVDMDETEQPRSPLEQLEHLYRCHATALLRLAVLMTGDTHAADEILHDAFLRYHRSAGAEPGRELAYLRRVIVNLARNHHRHLDVVARTPEARPLDAVAAGATAVRNTTDRRVAAAVRSLPPRQRECVVLHYFEELSDREIGDLLGISPGSVKTHLHRARERLRTELEELA